MSKRKTQEEFELEIKQLGHPITVIGEYKSNKTPILVKCNNCGHEWPVIPYTLRKHCNCPKCSNYRHWDHDEIVAEVAKIHPNIEVLGHFDRLTDCAIVRCKTCGREWTKQGNLLLLYYYKKLVRNEVVTAYDKEVIVYNGGL